MYSKNILLSLVTLLVMLLTACSSDAQTPTPTAGLSNTATIQVIQFHSEHRCRTCMTIEKLTKETLEKYPSVSFLLVNVDDKKNAQMAEKFEASGTALFLHNTSSGKKLDLTDFAFMNAGNKEAFETTLAKELDNFMQ